MIHLLDRRNVAIYAGKVSNAGLYITARPTPLELEVLNKDDLSKINNDNALYILNLGQPDRVTECLRIIRPRRQLTYGAILAEHGKALPPGAWLCTPVGPESPETGRDLQASEQLWIGALERSIQDADRTVATVMDPWRYALARRAGLPWRKIADIDGRLVLAAIDANRTLVQRLASRFGLSLPCGYHVDEMDLTAWGSLRRVEQEFDKLQILIDRLAANRQPPLGAGRR